MRLLVTGVMKEKMVCCNVMRIKIRSTSIYCLSNDGGRSGRFYGAVCVCCAILYLWLHGPGLVSVTRRSVIMRNKIRQTTTIPEGFQTSGVFVSSQKQKNPLNSAQRLKNTKNEQRLASRLARAPTCLSLIMA